MNARGFSLIETLVAVSITTVALSALAHLFVVSAQATTDARRATFASVLAAQKIEQLRGLGASLAPRPANSLTQNVDGLCDFIDEYGRSLGGASSPPTGTVYVRRWSVESVPFDPDTLLLQVTVLRRGAQSSVDPVSGEARLFGGAHLITLKTRRTG